VDMRNILKLRGSHSGRPTGTLASRYSLQKNIKDDLKFTSEVLGHGMSGAVVLAHDRDGRKYAVKQFRKDRLTPAQTGALKNEAEVYLALDHPNIVRLEHVYETEGRLNLVMEYMGGGELYARLAACDHCTEETARRQTRQILMAVAYLHEHKLIHRDIKLENFLYESEHSDELKLTDFGLTKFWDHRIRRIHHTVGTLYTTAPEVLCGAYTSKADMWSIGIIVCMLLTGGRLYVGTRKEVLEKIKTGRPEYPPQFAKLSLEAQAFVKALLALNPKDRPGAKEALKLAWLWDTSNSPKLDDAVLRSFRKFSRASSFRRACLSMFALSFDGPDEAAFREQFQALDIEGSGAIKRNFFKQRLHDLLCTDITKAEAEMIFNYIDTDCNDEITYQEFVAAMLQDRLEHCEDLLRRTFRRFDVEGSGKITAEDLRAVLGPDSNVNDFIREAGIDQTGAISYEEFLRYHGCQAEQEAPRCIRSQSLFGRAISDGTDEEDMPSTGEQPASRRTKSWLPPGESQHKPDLWRHHHNQ